MRPADGIIAWLVIGALAGWIGSWTIRTDRAMGTLANVVVGVLGAAIGGFIMRPFSVDHPGNNGLIATFLAALLGACILIATVKLVARHS